MVNELRVQCALLVSGLWKHTTMLCVHALLVRPIYHHLLPKQITVGWHRQPSLATKQVSKSLSVIASFCGLHPSYRNLGVQRLLKSHLSSSGLMLWICLEKLCCLGSWLQNMTRLLAAVSLASESHHYNIMEGCLRCR